MKHIVFRKIIGDENSYGSLLIAQLVGTILDGICDTNPLGRLPFSQGLWDRA